MSDDRQTLLMKKRFVTRQIAVVMNGGDAGGETLEQLQQRLADITTALEALPPK